MTEPTNDETPDEYRERLLQQAVGEAFNGFRRMYEAHITEARRERNLAIRERDVARANLRHANDLLERLKDEIPA